MASSRIVGFNTESVTSLVDIGTLILKSRESQCGTLTDQDREQALLRRWIPITDEDLPYSKHPVSGREVKRYLGRCFLDKSSASYREWLSVSKIDGVKGAWCVFCTMFKTVDFGGGKSADVGRGGGQRMGALVNAPLVNFKKLTGKDGVLDMHQISNFHKTCQIRVAEFENRVAGGGVHTQDIMAVIDTARVKEIQQNREILAVFVDVLLTCARQIVLIKAVRTAFSILLERI